MKRRRTKPQGKPERQAEAPSPQAGEQPPGAEDAPDTEIVYTGADFEAASLDRFASNRLMPRMPRPSVTSWTETRHPGSEDRPLRRVTTRTLRRRKEEIEARLRELRKAYPGEWRLRGIRESLMGRKMIELEKELQQIHLELLERDAEPRTAQTPAEAKATNGVTAIGRNIDRLRKECGWSFDELAKKIGIDKKSILSHVNKGTKPIPRILKEYAQTFSKELQQTITVSDLEK